MSDTSIDPFIRASLPKFKDKVMYVVSPKNVEQSYTISSSFKGILRLSPNDVSSVNEVEQPLELPEELHEIDTNYTDAIVFDDEASIKSLASIEKRMLVVSESTSYAVDLRISNCDVEFDKLNVVGISKFKQLSLYCQDDKNDKKSFKLGNSWMPSHYNDSSDIIEDGDATEYDVKKINVTDKGGDNSYILFGDKKNEDRVFSYGKTKNFIEELVMEALLDLETIPTGSIHFVPITLEQYKKLTKNDSKKPNKCEKDIDPILRDFLLCDGRLYNSLDFPELAKMLWNESVDYWRNVETPEGAGTKKTLSHKFEHKNEFGINEGVSDSDKINPGKYFRVPDMRRFFISSINANGIHDFKENAEIIKHNANRAGKWSPDNLPKSVDGDYDNHFHFIAYGTYSPIISFPFPNDSRVYTFIKGDRDKFTEVGVEKENDKNDIKLMRYIDVSDSSMYKPAVLTLTNHISWSKSVQLGPGFGTATGGLRRRKYYGYEPWPAIAYMAGPRTTSIDNKKNFVYSEPSVGRTSLAMICKVDPDDNRIAYGTDEDGKLNGELYQNIINSKTVAGDGLAGNNTTSNGSGVAYGYENAPKYFACLPLIKI